MKVLVFQGSPRIGGNTDLLVDAFIDGLKETGNCKVEKINLYRQNIKPCIECGECEKDGQCVLKDDMKEIYPKLIDADVVVIASPIFFYNITSLTQALIERSQALWVRKYMLKISESANKPKYGIFMAVGATKGKRLFEGVIRVVKYFFDAIDADYVGGLFYRSVEKKGDIKNHAEALKEAFDLGVAISKNASPNTWPLNRSDSP